VDAFPGGVVQEPERESPDVAGVVLRHRGVYPRILAEQYPGEHFGSVPDGMGFLFVHGQVVDHLQDDGDVVCGGWPDYTHDVVLVSPCWRVV
jgi:hypothetical protein